MLVAGGCLLGGRTGVLRRRRRGGLL
ncbi:MAG: hypothetical protein ACTHMY_08270 [Solirubrobacteraceae bacterium]